MQISVSNKASRPLYEQIVTQIKAQIMSGELQPGEALPSIRSLAKSLQISGLTVQKAYDQLSQEGFIETTRAATSRRRTRIFISKNSRNASKNISRRPSRSPAKAASIWSISRVS